MFQSSFAVSILELKGIVTQTLDMVMLVPQRAVSQEHEANQPFISICY
jgi:hypothetical protein